MENGTNVTPQLAPTEPQGGDVWHSLERLPEQGRVGGVCAAIAERHHVDVLLVRVAAMVLALGAGVGVGLYLAAWLMLPARGETSTILARQIPSTAQWSSQTKWWVTILGTALLASPMLEAGLPIGPALLALGVYWYLKRDQGNDQPNAALPPTPAAAEPLRLDPTSDFGRSVHAWQQRLASVDDPHHIPLALAPVAPQPVQFRTSTRPERRRANAPSTAFGLGAIATATAVGVGVGAVVPASVNGTLVGLSAALAVISAALVVGAFTRRPRFALLSAFVLAISMASTVFGGTAVVGDTDVKYTAASQLPAEPLDVTASDGRVDFSQLDVDGTATMKINARASDLEIIAPDDADLVIHYTLHASDMDVPADAERVKGSQSGTVTLDKPSDDKLVLEVEAWASNLEVR